MPLLLFGGFALASLLGVGSTVANSSEPRQDGRAPHLPHYPPPHGEAAYYPQQQSATYGPEVRLHPASNGHYYVRAQIGGQPVVMMVDTGSTGVVIDRATARVIGIPLERVRYDLPVRAGNGVCYAHRFAIPEIIVENRLAARGVDAIVHREDGGPNLLGMSFLDRFRVEMTGGEMIIRG